MLTSWHMSPASVDGARAALAALAEAARAGEPFRLVLTDALMPEIDGFALAEQIRADARLSGDQTHDADVGGPAARCGPLPRSRLRGVPDQADQAIRAARRDRHGASARRSRPDVRRRRGAASPSPPARDAPLRVLVAEDNRTNQKLVVALLEQHGHTVVVASNGREAVRRREHRPSTSS